jgi:hypothetical protein
VAPTFTGGWLSEKWQETIKIDNTAINAITFGALGGFTIVM